MKTQTIKRLDVMAALRAEALAAEITKHNATLRQIAYQREILASYEARLADTWKRGGVVTAGHAVRAERFSGASRTAGSQIDQLEIETRDLLAAAEQQLATLDAHRDSLDEALRKAEAESLRDRERRGERLQSWRSVPAGEV